MPGPLAKYTRDDLVDRLEGIRSGLPPVENPSGKESRIDLSISLLILTAEILEQDVQLQLNANKIRAFLCEYREKTYRSKMREEDEAYIRFVDCTTQIPSISPLPSHLRFQVRSGADAGRRTAGGKSVSTRES